jgi:hypothetical protein
MSILERQQLEYETDLLKELLTVQHKLSGTVDDELFKRYERNVKKLYNN